MNKLQATTLILTLPILSYATENDSITVKVKPQLQTLSISVDKEEIGDTTAITEEAEADSMLFIETLEEAIYYSDDIVEFEFAEIPVDEDLFRFHVSTLEFEIPMDYNMLVKSQINYFGTRWQAKLKKMITKSQYYFPIYESILDQYDMPLEIKYLSVIESGLNPRAYSRTGAAGTWQFMPATGRMFDLEINYKIDERRSIEKSTHAACQYLKRMYDMYGDWYVALASYNCGPGNVRKAMRNSGRTDFWGMYNYLPRETQNYVPKFIAMAYMMNFYSEYGIVPSVVEDKLFNTQKVYCEEGLDFSIIAEKLELTSKELMSLNPELKVPHLPFKDGEYYLSVPEEKAYLFYENQEEILSLSLIRAEELAEKERLRPKVVYHTVRRGECFLVIARKHGCSVSQLKSWNGIRGSTIYPNQKLKIIKT
ncbi:MAG: transglycosylase SLT domain-containing protein [Bacteroidia bacterium]|nr:transglycosylase SLT domain-containing protein [Bacteroidia bacterium]NNJ56833.1 transglycosylase SLT domain-containing protein [Bacteroidia bacterium]